MSQAEQYIEVLHRVIGGVTDHFIPSFSLFHNKPNPILILNRSQQTSTVNISIVLTF
jgi:hypothetical protein